MLDRAEQDQLLALLAWWKGAGVDVALDETPNDWTARPGEPPGFGYQWPDLDVASETSANASPANTPASARPSTQPAALQGKVRPPLPTARPQLSAVPPTARAFPTAKPDAAIMAAREAARSATTIAALEATLKSFDGCALKVTAKSLCFYRGNPMARVMLIGEAPGREDDLEGKPFVGDTGKMLDKMLAAIGLGEDDVHITNTVYWRPPGNRTPTPQEISLCRPFLDRQIELVAPDIIVTLGERPTKVLLNVEGGILRMRGKWLELAIAGRKIPVLPTFHPDYLLKIPASKRQAWHDLLAIKAALAAAPKG